MLPAHGIRIATALPWLWRGGASFAPRALRFAPCGVLLAACAVLHALDARAVPLAADSSPSAAPPSAAPPSAAPPVSSPASAPDRTPLPSYFTVELGAAGALYADGKPVASNAELEQVAGAAVSSGRFAGAVLFGDAGSGPALDGAAELLRRSGFRQLIDARRSAPRELSALARAEREHQRRERQRLVAAGVIEGEAAPRPGPAAAAATAPMAVASRLELQSVGLALSGPANQAAPRKRMLALFERSFPAFRRCHGDAPEHVEGASFGVDLLIPTEGGKAKVRQTRTRLAGNSFKSCMERAFQAIRFEPPSTARPEIVSYSVLFKPTKR